MRFIIYRPHSLNFFGTPVKSWLRGLVVRPKYKVLIDYLLECEIDLCLTAKLSDINTVSGVIKNWLDVIELLFWCAINRVPLRSVKIITSKNQILRDDCLLVMYYGNLAFESVSKKHEANQIAKVLAQVQCKKLVHLTHFFYDVKNGFERLKSVEPSAVIAESNLQKNSKIFQNFNDGLNAKMVCAPYVPTRRFRNMTEFQKRESKLIATGTLTYKMKDHDFIKTYDTDDLQPMRRKIYENASSYPNEIVSYIEDLNETEKVKIKRFNSVFGRIIEMFRPSNSQTDYFSNDIVSLYNKYQMFAVPEEIVGLPGIGAFEGMMCGSVLFAINDPMYTDIGLIPGYHYVEYDGSLDSLISKVRYYQSNQNQLYDISVSGQKFVVESLKKENVYKNLLNQIGFIK